MQNSFKFKGFPSVVTAPPTTHTTLHVNMVKSSVIQEWQGTIQKGAGAGRGADAGCHSSNATSTVQMSSRMNIKASHLQN